MKVYYEETYGGYYDVDVDNPEAAEKELLYLIGEGKENGPEECINSVVVPMDNWNPPDRQIMGRRLETMSEDEKKFCLWWLLRHYYIPRLRNHKEKYGDRRDVVEYTNKLINNAEEFDTLLSYEM